MKHNFLPYCLATARRLILAVTVLALLATLTPAAPTLHAQQKFGRDFNPASINLEPGYKIEVFAANLSIPTTAIFDGNDLLVAESGFVQTAPPRILRIKPDGSATEVAITGLDGPVTGLLVVNGQLYVSHRDKVSIVQPDKTLKHIVLGLPSDGDHQNNEIVLGPDGKIYMGQGTVTNSAVVGEDNYFFGWLDKRPSLREIPCKDITLVGQSFESGNPLTPDANDKVTTGAYKPFGQPSTPGEVIKGDPKCGGSIARFNPDGSGFEMYAWGLRNPFGLKFDKNGQLWATWHGADVRGSRNIFNDPDYFAPIKQDAWYGWPDYFDGTPVTDPKFKDPTKEQPQFLWKEHPPLTKAFTTFRSHAGTTGFDFSPGGNFGFEGDAFVALYGSFLPITTGPNIIPEGFSIAKVDIKTGKVDTIAANKVPGPHYINRLGGFDRPSDVVFGPDQSMYVVDWGSSAIGSEGLKLVPLTGSVWRIYKEGVQQALRPNGPIGVPVPPQIPEQTSEPEVRTSVQAFVQVATALAPYLIALLVIIIGILVFRRVRRRR